MASADFDPDAWLKTTAPASPAPAAAAPAADDFDPDKWLSDNPGNGILHNAGNLALKSALDPLLSGAEGATRIAGRAGAEGADLDLGTAVYQLNQLNAQKKIMAGADPDDLKGEEREDYFAYVPPEKRLPDYVNDPSLGTIGERQKKLDELIAQKQLQVDAMRQSDAKLADSSSGAAIYAQDRANVQKALPVDQSFSGSFPGKVISTAGNLAGSAPLMMEDATPLGWMQTAGMVYQSTYDDAKQHGASDSEASEAGMANLPSVIPQAIAEKFVAAGGEQLLGALTGKGAGMTWGQLAKNTAISSVAGGSGFTAQQMWSDAVAKYFGPDGKGYDPNRDVICPEDVKTFLIGAVSTGLLHGTGAAGGKLIGDLRAPDDTGANVPETDATLKAQQQQLVNGQRKAQMFPVNSDGEVTNELPFPDGMQRVETERGVFHYDPDQVTSDQILDASAQGRENELLGLGPNSKADVMKRAAAGEPLAAITERQPDGTEVKAAIATPSTAPDTMEEMNRTKTPGNTVQVDPVGDVIDQRGGNVGGNFMDAIMAEDAKKLQDQQASQQQEQTARAQRLLEMAQRRAQFNDHVDNARNVYSDPDAPYAAVQGTLATMKFYAETNGLGLTQDQKQTAQQAASALAKRLTELQPAEDARLAQVKAAAQADAAAKAVQLKAAPPAAEAEPQPQPTTPEEEFQQQQREEREAALQAAGGVAFLDALKKVKLPNDDDVLGGELKHLISEDMTPGQRLQFVRKDGRSLDKIAETLRNDYGFSNIQTPADVIDTAQRALRGEQIIGHPMEEPEPAFASGMTAADAVSRLNDASAEEQALRSAFPELTKNVRIKIGQVRDLLRQENFKGNVPDDVQAAVLQAAGEAKLIALSAEHYRNREKGAALLTHELAHPYYDALPEATKAALREQRAHEISTKTGPLYDAKGRLRSDLAGVEENSENGVKEWFAERIARLNEAWVKGRIDAGERSTLLRRVWMDFIGRIRTIWSQLAARQGINPESELFERQFRRYVQNGLRGDVSEVGAAYARGRGGLNIEPMRGLSPDERQAEQAFSRQLEADPEAAAQQYAQIPDTQGGKVLNVDIARELFEPYAKDRESRARYSRATHAPASALIDMLYRRRLNDPETAGKPVVFLAGGGGSGKSTVQRMFGEAMEKAGIIMDNTLSGYEGAKRRVSEALASNHPVKIYYVHRPIEAAVGAFVERAKTEGRSIPIDRIAANHFNAQKTLGKLAADFGDKIDIHVIDNSRGRAEATRYSGQQGLDLLKSKGVNYSHENEVIQRARAAYAATDKAGLAPESSAIFETKGVDSGGNQQGPVFEGATGGGISERGGRSEESLSDESTAESRLNPDDVIRNADKVEPIPKVDRKTALLEELQRARDMAAEGNRTGNDAALNEGVRRTKILTERLDDEFPGWEKDRKPAAAQPPPGVMPPESRGGGEPQPERLNQLYGHSAYEPGVLEKGWRRVAGILSGIRGSVPELPSFPAAWWNKADNFIKEHGPDFYNPMKEFARTLKSGNDYVRYTAQEQLKKIVEPLLNAGGKFNADEYRRLQSRQEQVRRLQADGKPVPPGVRAEINALNAKLEDNPYVLFNRLAYMLDLNWRAKNLHDPFGNPIKLPGGIDPAGVEAELRRLGSKIAASPNAKLIESALRQHMALVKGVADDLKARGLLSGELANPYYFPHLTLEMQRGDKTVQRELRLEHVRPGTDADFRGYLVDPVGSNKPIETDYAKAMFYHLVQVGAHNWKADAVAQVKRSYDVMDGIVERAKTLAKVQDRPVSWQEVFHREYEPEGYTLYGAGEKDAFPAVTIDPDVLAQRVGANITATDLRGQLKQLGLQGITLLPEDLREIMVQGSRETWVVPARVAEALRGVADRDSQHDGAISSALRWTLGMWKNWKLFAPHNYIRYEFNKSTTDLEKLWSADPRAFRQIPAAFQEMRSFWSGGTPNDDLRAALKAGALNAITAQEMGKLEHQAGFREMQTRMENLAQQLKARGSTLLTQPITSLLGLGHLNSVELSSFIGEVFRYAKFKSDLDAIRNGSRPNYAGAYWRDVDSLSDSAPGANDAAERQAAAISRATFGDYHSLSVLGENLRAKLIPFYSWLEVNFKYHANLFRNLRDQVNGDMTRGEAVGAGVRAAAAFAAGNAVRATAGAGVWAARAAAAGLITRLLAPYIAAGIWNNSDDRAELEKLLSAEDQRRFHIILGESDDGNAVLRDGRKINIIYAPTALMDLMRWFSGQELARQMGAWMGGQTDFVTAMNAWRSQLGPDFANNTANYVGPFARVAYMAISKKNPFPDVEDQRTIPAYDFWRTIGSEMTDDFTADMISRVVDKNYYSTKDMGDWARQLILQVRERDPDAWAFYDIRDKAAKFLEDQTGTKRDSSYDAPDAQVLRNFRRALYRGDVTGAITFYNTLLGYGYTSERFAAGIKGQDPLSELPARGGLRGDFINSLSAPDREELQRAFTYYERIADLKTDARTLFPSERFGKAGLQMFQNNPRYDQLQQLLMAANQMQDEDLQQRGAVDLQRELIRPRR